MTIEEWKSQVDEIVMKALQNITPELIKLANEVPQPIGDFVNPEHRVRNHIANAIMLIRDDSN